MGTNAAQFNRELKNELNAAGPENFVKFRADLAGDIISIAASRSPIGRTKRLVKSWGISFSPDRKGGWVYGSGAARAALRGTRIGQRVWLGNSWFVSGFFENGTPKMGARPMLRPAIEAVRNRKR